MSNVIPTGKCENAIKWTVGAIRDISPALIAIATLVCIVSLLIIAGDHLHNLTHVGGGYKPEIVQIFWSTAMWSGIISAINVGLVVAAGCTAAFMVVHRKS